MYEFGFRAFKRVPCINIDERIELTITLSLKIRFRSEDSLLNNEKWATILEK